MYICEDCGYVFEQPLQYRERHGLDSPPYEQFPACPACCGSFTDAAVCQGCGMAFADEEGYGICPACLSGLRRRLNRLLEGSFTPREVEILRELVLDGLSN